MARQENEKVSRANRLRSGFTLVELLVVAPIVILMISGFIIAIISLTGEALVSSVRNTLTYDLQLTFSRIDDDVRRSAGFLATNSFTPISPQGIDDGTASFENATASGDALILRMFATTKQPQSPGSSVVVMKNLPYTCDSASAASNAQLVVNVAYFVRNDSLWRRVLMPSDYATAGCEVPWQLPSCTPGYVAAYCGSNDELLIEGVEAENFNLSYYSSSASTTPIATASDHTQTTSARSGALGSALTVRVDVTAGQMVAGSMVTEEGHVRSSRSYANVTPGYFE
ncbi:hypothetical protein GW930_02165 [Candidatus Saccharibacteria bacterium]|nr:hypothetical protein [Candidatus Saccharibacteria bacterium]